MGLEWVWDVPLDTQDIEDDFSHWHTSHTQMETQKNVQKISGVGVGFQHCRVFWEELYISNHTDPRPGSVYHISKTPPNITVHMCIWDTEIPPDRISGNTSEWCDAEDTIFTLPDNLSPWRHVITFSAIKNDAEIEEIQKIELVIPRPLEEGENYRTVFWKRIRVFPGTEDRPVLGETYSFSDLPSDITIKAYVGQKEIAPLQGNDPTSVRFRLPDDTPPWRKTLVFIASQGWKSQIIQKTHFIVPISSRNTPHKPQEEWTQEKRAGSAVENGKPEFPRAFWARVGVAHERNAQWEYLVYVHFVDIPPEWRIKIEMKCWSKSMSSKEPSNKRAKKFRWSSAQFIVPELSTKESYTLIFSRTQNDVTLVEELHISFPVHTQVPMKTSETQENTPQETWPEKNIVTKEVRKSGWWNRLKKWWRSS